MLFFLYMFLSIWFYCLCIIFSDQNVVLEVSILSGNPVMTCILYRSSAALFSRNSHVLMRSSLYRLPKAAWKRDILHVCIGVIRSDCFILGFGIRCFSSQESQTSGIRKENLKPLMDEESDAFYVVRKGDIIGVYKSLSDCQAQVSSSVDPLEPSSLYFSCLLFICYLLFILMKISI